jgi:hypothetical protein
MQICLNFYSILYGSWDLFLTVCDKSVMIYFEKLRFSNFENF